MDISIKGPISDKGELLSERIPKNEQVNFRGFIFRQLTSKESFLTKIVEDKAVVHFYHLVSDLQGLMEAYHYNLLRKEPVYKKRLFGGEKLSESSKNNVFKNLVENLLEERFAHEKINDKVVCILKQISKDILFEKNKYKKSTVPYQDQLKNYLNNFNKKQSQQKTLSSFPEREPRQEIEPTSLLDLSIESFNQVQNKQPKQSVNSEFLAQPFEGMSIRYCYSTENKRQALDFKQTLDQILDEHSIEDLKRHIYGADHAMLQGNPVAKFIERFAWDIREGQRFLLGKLLILDYSNKAFSDYRKDEITAKIRIASYFNGITNTLLETFFSYGQDNEKQAKFLLILYFLRDELLEPKFNHGAPKDFLSAMGIHRTIDNMAITRLKNIQKLIEEHYSSKEQNKKFDTLFDPKENFLNLRTNLKNLLKDGKPFIPFAPVNSRDFLFWFEANVPEKGDEVDVECIKHFYETVVTSLTPAIEAAAKDYPPKKSSINQYTNFLSGLIPDEKDKIDSYYDRSVGLYPNPTPEIIETRRVSPAERNFRLSDRGSMEGESEEEKPLLS